VLRLKVTSSPVLDDVTALLAECLQPPPPAAVREAFNELLEAGTIAVCWLSTVFLSAVYLLVAYLSVCWVAVCASMSCDVWPRMLAAVENAFTQLLGAGERTVLTVILGKITTPHA
jgi:hypothetical protein